MWRIKGGCRGEETELLQQHLGSQYRNVVYERNPETIEARVMFSGPPANIPLYMQHTKDEKTGYRHYSTFFYITSYLRIRWYCDMCLKGYQYKHLRKYKYTCSYWEARHITEDEEKGRFKCTCCYRTFPSMVCITNNKKAPKIGLYETCNGITRLPSPYRHPSTTKRPA